MGMLSFEVPHTLSKEEARKRTEALLAHWGNKYGLTTAWSGDQVALSGKVMGITLKGTLQVAHDKVGGEASDPGFLFRDKARQYLTQKFKAYLDPAANLESLEQEG